MVLVLLKMLKLASAAAVATAVLTVASVSRVSSESTASSAYLQSYDFDFMAEPTLEEVLQARRVSIPNSIVILYFWNILPEYRPYW